MIDPFDMEYHQFVIIQSAMKKSIDEWHIVVADMILDIDADNIFVANTYHIDSRDDLMKWLSYVRDVLHINHLIKSNQILRNG